MLRSITWHHFLCDELDWNANARFWSTDARAASSVDLIEVTAISEGNGVKSFLLATDIDAGNSQQIRPSEQIGSCDGCELGHQCLH